MGKKDVKNAKRIKKNKIITYGIYKNIGFQVSIFFFYKNVPWFSKIFW